MRAQGLPCWLCGFPIDYGLPSTNDLGFVVDEEVPVCEGGDPYDPRNTHPAHRCCNAWRGRKRVTPELKAAIRKRFMALARSRKAKTDRTIVRW